MSLDDEPQAAGFDRPGFMSRIHMIVMLVLLAVMGVELVLLVLRARWFHAALVVGIVAATLAPFVLRRRASIVIPSEIQLAAILFAFATLFLGEVRDYYHRIWWWDLALHGTAGLLLGLLGFLVVYMLNVDRRVDLHMRPSFVALFAFLFAVGVGTLWEIFEFTMDQTFGLNMQKPMFGDPSGLTDTMWDLILDTLGAAVVSFGGWRYVRRARPPSIDNMARRFVEKYPYLFTRVR